MNSRGIFAAYNGMLSIAARRDERVVRPAARARRRGIALRLFRLV
jgi:hypothetical protein